MSYHHPSADSLHQIYSDNCRTISLVRYPVRIFWETTGKGLSSVRMWPSCFPNMSLDPRHRAIFPSEMIVGWTFLVWDGNGRFSIFWFKDNEDEIERGHTHQHSSCVCTKVALTIMFWCWSDPNWSSLAKNPKCYCLFNWNFFWIRVYLVMTKKRYRYWVGVQNGI